MCKDNKLKIGGTKKELIERIKSNGVEGIKYGMNFLYV